MILEENRKFIMSEPMGKDGEDAEKKVWESVKNSFAERNCIAYWKYPIFSRVGETRKEPDVLIADKELGLIVIEVKGIKIEQLKSISGHVWSFDNFYVNSANPYEQAENQLFALLAHVDMERSLRRKVHGKVLIALPFITRQEWANKGFDKLPSCPPVIFGDEMGKVGFLNKIINSSNVVEGVNLEQSQWELLLSVLKGDTVLRKNVDCSTLSLDTRAGILKILKQQLYDIDLQQDHIGKIIPPGPQRIRGIAGSGKTVLLCEKAAHMHLKHPEWDIALVFFTRSLYDIITKLVDKWMRFFTNGEKGYDPDNNSKLKVLHTWGAKDRDGFYGELCRKCGVKKLTVGDIKVMLQPNEKFAVACNNLLKSGRMKQVFDAVLIDEAQDLVVDKEELKFEDKQPFFWMAYQSLRPVDKEHPKDKRLIWAYDEAQSLDNLKIPAASELFGNDPELRKMVSGSYPGNILKSEIMSRCYRTPGLILTSAHAIGMGLLRKDGMLRGFTNKEDWEKIGYKIEKGSFNPPGQEIIINRPEENSPNLVSRHWKEPVLNFRLYNSVMEQLNSLVKDIKYNIEVDKLNPSRDILIVVLGKNKDADTLLKSTASYLIRNGIDIYVPTALNSNVINPQYPETDNDKFWEDGAVTISKIHRAKGNEADMVYVIGLENVAAEEGNINLRNQVFVALTRARGWVKLCGVGGYPMYEEVRKAIEANGRFKFVFRRPQKQDLGEMDG